MNFELSILEIRNKKNILHSMYVCIFTTVSFFIIYLFEVLYIYILLRCYLFQYYQEWYFSVGKKIPSRAFFGQSYQDLVMW